MNGKLVFIGEKKQVSENLATQQFAVEWQKEIKGTMYARTTCFEQKDNGKYDSIKHFKDLKVGDEVEVQYNEPESRAHNGRYYTSVEAWSVKKQGGGSTGASAIDDDDSMPF
jgi:hypothetical protein